MINKNGYLHARSDCAAIGQHPVGWVGKLWRAPLISTVMHHELALVASKNNHIYQCKFIYPTLDVIEFKWCNDLVHLKTQPIRAQTSRLKPITPSTQCRLDVAMLLLRRMTIQVVLPDICALRISVTFRAKLFSISYEDKCTRWRTILSRSLFDRDSAEMNKD